MNRKMLSSPSPRRGSRVVSLLTIALVVAVPALSSAQRIELKAGTSSTTQVNMRVPDVLGDATVTGHLSGSTILNVSLSLAPSNRAAFQAYANSVSDPSSPLYHHFLTPLQIGAKFGASTSTVNTAAAYLKSKGLTIKMVSDNHMGVLCSGRADKIESAFSTRLNTYYSPSRTDGPKNFFSYNSVPKVPATFASNVVSVGGLQNAYRPLPRMPLSPTQARKLYAADTRYGNGLHGEGINVGISNYDGYSLSNASLFYNQFFSSLGGSPNITKVNVGGDGEATGIVAEGEGDLDFQMILAIAPKAHIYIYDDPVTSDYVAVRMREAQDNMVDIVTESYGFPTRSETASFIAAAHNQQMALTVQGITYLCASGDDGTDLKGFDYPDFDPDVLMVGGTTGDVDSAGNRLNEIGWVGSGSGYSTFNIDFNVRPSYQTGPGVPNNSNPNFNRRLFPDVAVRAWGTNKLFADSGPTDGAYLVFEQGVLTQYQGGGTSAAAPCMAGQLALILQQLKLDEAVDPSAGGRYRLGRVNDFFYTLIGNNNAFYDITVGDSGLLADGVTEAVAGIGWDFVTGVGAPNDEGLYNAFLSLASSAVIDAPSSASLYSITSPSLTLGTVVGGSAASLSSTDGVSYLVQSVKQNGVGQVAAATVAVPLQKAKQRRSASISVAVQLPAKATGYLYLLRSGLSASNPANYDLVSTIAGTGLMGTTTLSLDVDANTYITGSTGGVGGTVTAIVRSLIPTRLGTAPFTMTVDRLTVTERVSKN